MKRLARVLLALAVLLPSLLGLGVTQPAQACSCAALAEPGGVEWDAIFLGVVRNAGSPFESTSGPAARRFEFAVERVWRGEIARQQTVFTAAYSESCGYEFQQGVRYLVHGNSRPDGTVQVSLCSPTASGPPRLLEDLNARVGPSHLPGLPATTNAGLQSDWPRLALAGVIAVALGAATVFVAGRH